MVCVYRVKGGEEKGRKHGVNGCLFFGGLCEVDFVCLFGFVFSLRIYSRIFLFSLILAITSYVLLVS